LVGVTPAAQPIRRSVRSNPKPDFDRPIAEQATTLLVDACRSGAHQLESADDARSAGELVERQEA
jgi:hypothetical protein